MMSALRLAALRSLMSQQPVALSAYIVPTADAHNSEYISPADARREWISGFTGSAGTAVVTAQKALVWTDGRYYTQFQQEVDMSIWTLMKQSLPDTPPLEKWLTANLDEGAVVGADPNTMSRDEWMPLHSALKKANMQLIAICKNLVDEARVQLNDPAPMRPSNSIMPLPIRYTGRSAGDKIKELRDKIAEKKVSALVVTALDEIAYVLNLRGSDIQYNPVFFSYLIITPTSVKLFTGNGQVSPIVTSHLAAEGVTLELHPYTTIITELHNFSVDLSHRNAKHSIWLSSDASEAIHRAASGVETMKQPLNLTSEVSPVALMKLIKNDVELEGFRQCHIRDGIAVVRFFKWLHENIDAGNNVTEIQASDKLLEFRKDGELFAGPSFETIAGTGPNGAIIHYSPSRDGPQSIIQNDHMFLLDSGGQYKDGTTDITRTRHMGRPTAQQRDTFTRVLKGQIMVGSAIFPRGVKGNTLDSFARHALWAVGLDYAHGTGHGVGHHLNVHEGPAGVSWRPFPNDPGLAASQILSNEPGYYEVGEYGIRHEDLVEIIAVTKDTDHPKAKDLKGDFNGLGALGFRTLTLVPNQRRCIDVSMLNDDELDYINSYHKRVYETLAPILEKKGLMEDLKWLQNECDPITRE